MRRYLICECGNRDDEDVSDMNAALPPCSAGCGRTMRVVEERRLPANVTAFRRLRVPSPPPVSTPPLPKPVPQAEKMALYPLAEDVLVSLPLFRMILLTLEYGTAEDRATLAASLRESYSAPFV